MSRSELQRAYESLKAEGVRLAGGLTDLSQRATVYHHLFRASGGNHAFPLIAAHGALWAGGYFRFGMRLGRWLSWQYAFSPRVRRLQQERLEAFANAFRDINRRVCVDTYVNFHLTARYGDHPQVAEFVPVGLLGALRRLHAANNAEQELSDEAKREIFLAHFLHEQEHVVGPSILEAVREFDWPLVRFIALRPVLRFAFFGAGQRFWFRNFADRDERIARGLQAFDIAAQSGWSHVEEALRQYRIFPESFFAGPIEYFTAMRTTILQTA